MIEDRIFIGDFFYVISSFAVSAFCMGFIIYLLALDFRVVIRPTFILASLIFIFFQIPSIIVSESVVLSIDSIILFWMAVNFPVLALLVWVWFTPALNSDFPELSPATLGYPFIAILVGIALLLTLIYLHRVPAQCTALYSVLFDPVHTLLAREVSVKFAGTTLATYSYGALANSIGPAIIGLSIGFAWHSILRGRFLPLLLACALVPLTITVILLGGAKGLLVPAALFAVGSGLVWNRSLLGKAGYLAFAACALAASLVAFEMYKDRSVGPSAGAGYAFGRCVAELDACSDAYVLTNSLHQREYSLGLSFAKVDQLQLQLDRVCPVSARLQNESDAAPEDATVQSETQFTPIQIDPGKTSVSDYLYGLIYRAFVSPIQVGAWYFKYAEDFGRVGINGISLVQRITKEYNNIPQIIYQEYGVKFSGGDATSTSTAPTNSIIAYPSYMGVVGVFLVIILLIVFDLVYMLIVKSLPSSAVALAAGFAPIISFNLILSDFFTTMMSHGAAAAILLLVGIAVLNKVGLFGSGSGKSEHLAS